MESLLRYRGREVSAAEVELIGRLIAEHPQASRRRLSQLLCEAWGWRQPNGTLCDMVCRGLMLALERAGHIDLPAVRQVNGNPLAKRGAQRKRPGLPEIDTNPLVAELCRVQPLLIRQVRRSAEESLCNGLIERYHYLGYCQPVGEHLKYPGSADCLPGVLFRPSAPGQPGPLHRLESRGPAAQHPISGL